jgi:hypothetical protein
VNVTLITLAAAKLCMNCEFISDAKHELCPKCGCFANWLPLGKLLEPLAPIAEVSR